MSHKILEGKKGIVFGALDSSSIAWKTAEAIHKSGGKFVLTNAPVALRMGSISELAKQTNSSLIPADATNMDDLSNLIDETQNIFANGCILKVFCNCTVVHTRKKFPVPIQTQTQGLYRCQKVPKLLKNHVLVSTFATMLLNLRKTQKSQKNCQKNFFSTKCTLFRVLFVHP